MSTISQRMRPHLGGQTKGGDIGRLWHGLPLVPGGACLLRSELWFALGGQFTAWPPRADLLLYRDLPLGAAAPKRPRQ